MDLRLVRRDDEYVILAEGQTLMSSRLHGSEEALASLACGRLGSLPRPAVLVAGLGMGFTLRATLDRLPPSATVVVAELVPEVVEWNRGPLGPLADHPVRDARVRVEEGDVAAILRTARGRFDAILFDVDNGPAAFSTPGNAWLYADAGVSAVRSALRDGGLIAVWSARDDRAYERRLRDAGFRVSVERVRARLTRGGSHHVIILGQKRAGGAGS